MDNLAADFTIENNEPLTADYELNNDNTLACSFEIFASGTVWGSIAGDINNQTDLINILNDKVDLTSFNDLSETVTNNYDELSGDISDLTGTVSDNYSTLSGQISDLTGVVDDNYTSLDNRLTTAEGSVLNLTDTVSSNYTELNNKITANSNNIIVLNRTVVNNDTVINNRVDGIVESFNEDISDLSNRVTANSDNITTIQNAINTYGDIVTYNAANFATSAQGTLADTALQPNDNISELVNNVGYITSANLPTVNNASITIQRNGTNIESFTLNQANNETINILVPTDTADLTNSVGFITSASIPTVNNSTITIQKNGTAVGNFTLNQATGTAINLIVPTKTSDLTNDSGFITSNDLPTIEDLTTTAQLNAINSGATSTNIGQIATNTNAIADINDLIPIQATASNQLADKSFVNSSIATNTANFIGTFNSVAELEAYSGTLTNNDYAFVATTDSAGNTLYDRYKYNANTQQWIFEYELNNSSFTAQQWASINSGITSGDVTLIGTALQPNDNISELTNDAGYITSASLPTVNNATLTIQKNGTTVNTFTANSSTNTTANITVPTDTLDLTNGAGYITGITSSDITTALGYTPYNSTNPNGYISGITSTDVTNALGFTPYDASNPNGYTSNIGTVTSVNNIAPVSGNVTINIPTDTADLTNGAGFITSADLPTNNVTTDTVQTITARKTFTGEKAIYFKQVVTTNKLGFTLYNPSDTELGAFEFRPNTISGGALLNVNVPYSSSNYVGFRYWGTAVNVIAPKVTTAGNYFIPTHITDGNTTVTANSAGLINISSLLPSGGAVDSVNGQTGDVVLTASDVGALPNTTVIPTKTSDLTNDSDFTTSNDFKTINNTSIVGSGNITINEPILYSTTGQNTDGAMTQKAVSDLGKYANVRLNGASVSDDFLLSGFSNVVCPTIPQPFMPNTNTWEMIFKFHYVTSTSNQIIFDVNNGFAGGRPVSIFTRATNNKVAYCLSSTLTEAGGGDILWDTDGSNTLVTDTDYYVKLEFTGSAYNGYISTDGETWTQDITVASTTAVASGYIGYLGYWQGDNAHMQGTIDLKESYININGERWWNGVETIKSLDDIRNTSVSLGGNSPQDVCTYSAPSISRVNIALPASGGNFIAPHDGYIVFVHRIATSGQFIALANSTRGIYSQSMASANNALLRLWTICRKSDVITVEYSGSSKTTANNSLICIRAIGGR